MGHQRTILLVLTIKFRSHQGHVQTAQRLTSRSHSESGHDEGRREREGCFVLVSAKWGEPWRIGGLQ